MKINENGLWVENPKEIMRKIIVFLLSAFLFSSCILMPGNLPTPIPASLTPINDPFPLPENTELPEPTETKITIPTATLTAVNTSVPTETATEVPVATSTPQNTATPFPFSLQTGTPVFIKNFAHPSDGCDWLGVAGQIFDEDRKPLLNHVVMITGKIEGTFVDFIGVTGVPEADIYGPGGFEIQVADHIFASEKALSIQVFNLDGFPISDSIPFDTLDDCEKNLVIINFQTAK